MEEYLGSLSILNKGGYVVKASDLYDMEFEPILSRANFTTIKEPSYYQQQ